MVVGSSLYEYDFKLVGDSDIKISDTYKILGAPLDYKARI